MSIKAIRSLLVPAISFATPNGFLIRPCYRPVYLLNNQASPSIDHVHSVKSLLKTLSEIQSLVNHPTLGQFASSQLNDLIESKYGYSQSVTEYISKGGLLTAQGIANVYFSAQQLEYTAEWLDSNVHHEIPHKISYMSVSNLEDTIKGLEKYHPNSPYLERLRSELKDRPRHEIEYVQYDVNQTNKFTLAQDVSSNNLLIKAGKRGYSSLRYQVESLVRNFLQRGKYILHNQ